MVALRRRVPVSWAGVPSWILHGGCSGATPEAATVSLTHISSSQGTFSRSYGTQPAIQLAVPALLASRGAPTWSTRFTALQQQGQAAPYSSASAPLFSKLLVANRGEIACRVLKTARKLGIGTVAVYSEADRNALHVQLADEAYCIGKPPARDSYLRAASILDVALKSGAQAIHPGYGFLSESAAFSEACASAGVVFVGPPAPAIRAMGDKARSKEIMSAAGVPVVPGYHAAQQEEERLVSEAERCGFPLLVKAVSGGGGKGMKLAMTQGDLLDAIWSARREAASSFGDDRLLLERYIMRPRHIEVQVFCDSHGGAVYLFDRDCSLQRRHQKVLEEAPAPGLPDSFHKHIGEAAVRAARAVGYVNAGTVEFIVDTDTSDFYFMEMNTRLQVEHPVSEAITGQDFVEWQLRVAAGQHLPLSQEEVLREGPRGHSLEARLYAESPRNNFLPGGGYVRRWRVPEGAVSFERGPLRVDSGVREGDEVGTFYDPMIAKVVVHAEDRQSALAAMASALKDTQVAGLPTNLEFLRRAVLHPAFVSAERLDTSFIPQHRAELLAPQPLPPPAAALAAVARHLLKVEEQRAADKRAGGAPLGPWDMGDSKRLWHTHRRTISMHHGAGERDVALEVEVEGKDMFKVTINPPAKQETYSSHKQAKHGKDVPLPQPSSPSSPSSSSSSLPTEMLPVRYVRLDTASGRLTAEVAGQRCCADVLLHRSVEEEVLHVWMDGEHYEFNWPMKRWSKDASASAAASDSSGRVSAPMPGRITAVLVKDGDVVAAGAPLVVMEAMKMEHSVVAPVAGVVRQVAVVIGAQVAQGQVMAVVEQQKQPASEGQQAQGKAHVKK